MPPAGPHQELVARLFGVQGAGASDVRGVLERSAAAALLLGAFRPIFSALGAAMSAATYLLTLNFFLSTPGVAEATAGGLPAISAAGQFLLKDLVLLNASLCLRGICTRTVAQSCFQSDQAD